MREEGVGSEFLTGFFLGAFALVDGGFNGRLQARELGVFLHFREDLGRNDGLERLVEILEFKRRIGERLLGGKRLFESTAADGLPEVLAGVLRLFHAQINLADLKIESPGLREK